MFLPNLSQAHQSLQPWLGGDGGWDHERQPFKVQVPRGRPPRHGHQPLWTQDPFAHGQSPHHYRGTAPAVLPPKEDLLMLSVLQFHLQNSPFDLVNFFFWKRQKLVQAANGVETQVIDGKVEIENGNVPEDKPSDEPENETISPFHIPSM